MIFLSALTTTHRQTKQREADRFSFFGCAQDASGCAIKKMKSVVAFFLGTIAFLAASAQGQQYQVLHQFHPNPANPSGLIQGTDGNFYGTTSEGGVSGGGRVFKMDAAGAVTTLHSFIGSDGVRPLAALVQGSDGNLYGATNFGGASGLGTVFKITPSGTFTSLHSFAGSDGKNPQFGRWIQASDGNFYGTTITGGAKGVGTVFKITPSGTFTTLHSFTGSEGSYPSAGLIQGSDGNFYGTAALGGTGGFGTVFQMDAAGTVTRLYSFTRSAGSYPQAELLEGSDGTFYGTTPFGGAPNNVLNRGTVFKITSAGTFTLLHSFAGIDGANPQAGLIKASDGNFYGTTYGTTNLEADASSVGTVFKIDSTGTLTTVHSFARSDGARLSAGVIQASDGNFFGATNQGGPEDDGTLFKMNVSGNVTTLHSFTGGDGFIPRGGLTQASDGNFYGTTNVGGVSGAAGTIFKMDSSGTLTTLHSFTGGDGVYPSACRLIDGNDGNFYGTTQGGGLVETGFGTVFKITPAGVVTTLHSFARADGEAPAAGLTKGSDGNFYGLTTFGGAFLDGTVFKITPSGAFTSLHSFAGSDGQFPFGTVVQGSDGNFYGTTIQGGAFGAGTVFKMDASGAVTTLHSFIGNDGAQPYGGLTAGSDGTLYGMTTTGGEGHDARSGPGTVFMITPLGAFTTLHSFLGLDGQAPFGELTLGRDGNFYGTTQQGGASFNAATFTSGFGTVFKMTPAGALTTLHSFAGNAASDGASPYGGPIQASDGSFYGTTEGGGLSFVGVAYRLAAPEVQLAGAVSRKMHGAAGTFDINLPLTGTRGIECRSGGANGDHTMVFTFVNPLTSVGGVSMTGTGSASGAIDSTDARRYIVNLTGVANAQTVTVSLANVNDSAGNSSASVSAPMAVLVGDVNATRVVDGNDVSAVQGKTRQPVSDSTFRYDVNVTGTIDGNDVSTTQSKTRTRLP